MGGGGPPSVNAGSIFVTLRALEEREASQEEVMIRAREVLRRYPGELRTSIQESGGGGGGMGVQYTISGPDLRRLADTPTPCFGRSRNFPSRSTPIRRW